LQPTPRSADGAAPLVKPWWQKIRGTLASRGAGQTRPAADAVVGQRIARDVKMTFSTMWEVLRPKI